MNGKTTANRMKKYRAIRRNKGLKLVRVWVSIDNVELVKEVAKAIEEGKVITIDGMSNLGEKS